MALSASGTPVSAAQCISESWISACLSAPTNSCPTPSPNGSCCYNFTCNHSRLWISSKAPACKVFAKLAVSPGYSQDLAPCSAARRRCSLCTLDQTSPSYLQIRPASTEVHSCRGTKFYSLTHTSPSKDWFHSPSLFSRASYRNRSYLTFKFFCPY